MNFSYEQNRIFLLDNNGKQMAEITFPNVREGVVNINHVFVDPSLRGQGIASQLVEAACHEIHKQGKKAVATCPYAVDWFSKHQVHLEILEK